MGKRKVEKKQFFMYLHVLWVKFENLIDFIIFSKSTKFIFYASSRSLLLHLVSSAEE